MSDIITCSIYFIEILIINVFDYKRFRTFINPIFFLSIPFTIVFILCELFNKKLGFVDFYIPSLWIWIIGLFFFWLLGNGIVTLIKKDYKKICKANNELPIFIFILCILISVFKFNSLDNSLTFGSKELGSEMGMGGLIGRASNILLLMFPFIVTYNLNKIKKIGILLLLFIFLISLGSKTWIMNAIMASFIMLLVERKIKISPKSIFVTLIIILVLLFAFFFLYYKLNTNIEENEALIIFVSRHFYFYLTSGILPLGIFFKIGTNVVVNEFQLPFINILEIWLGNEVSSVHSPLWYITDLQLGTQSNVFTFFGTLFIGSSFSSFLFHSAFLGIWCYLLFMKARVKSNIYLNIVNAFNLSILFFGWYNCSFAILRIWEITIYCFIFYYLSRIKYRRTL